MHDQVAAAGRVAPASAKATPSAAATPARVGSTSTSVTSTPGIRGEQPGDAAADHAGADDGHPVADQRGRVPQRVDGGLDGPGEHGALGRHVVGHHGERVDRDDVRRLVRVEAEHRPPAQRRRALLDDADAEVAVLHRPGQVAVLERRAHHGVLAGRHPPPEDQRLGAAADPGAQRAHQRLARPGARQPHAPDLAGPGSRTQNACACVVHRPSHPAPLNRGRHPCVLPAVPR